jgi:hypothetical protein
MSKEQLIKKIKSKGEKHPKKHGEWYSLKIYNNHYLVLDTWNGDVYHYPNGATPTDTNNMYRCVYTFLDEAENPNNWTIVKGRMIRFWNAMIT